MFFVCSFLLFPPLALFLQLRTYFSNSISDRWAKGYIKLPQKKKKCVAGARRDFLVLAFPLHVKGFLGHQKCEVFWKRRLILIINHTAHALKGMIPFFVLAFPRRRAKTIRILVYVWSILGDPGAVSRVRRKGGTKVFKYGRKSPWVPTLIELFPKIQADAGSFLGTKNALYYCAQSANSFSIPELFSWVRTRRLLSRYTCPVRSPSLCVLGKLLFSTFLTRNEGTTDESKKRLGCYQQEQFNLPREYSVFDGSQCIVNNRKFGMCGGDEKVK